MDTQAYTSEFDGDELTTGDEIALDAIRYAIESRRQAKGDWADARLSTELHGYDEIDGETVSVQRVWARQGEEEFLVYELGGADFEARVEPQNEEHVGELPRQGGFALR